MKPFLLLLPLILASLACSSSVLSGSSDNTPTPTTPAYTPSAVPTTPSPWKQITVTGNAYLRDSDTIVRKEVLSGQTLIADCGIDWCKISNGLMIWRGCTSEANGRKCLPAR